MKHATDSTTQQTTTLRTNLCEKSILIVILFFNLREITNSSLFITEKEERGEEMMSSDVSEL
jgi:hypothetical protein